MKCTHIATVLLCFSAAAVQEASAQIVVDDAPIAAGDVLATAPLVAYRKIPDDAIMADYTGDHWSISPTAVVGSADPQNSGKVIARGSTEQNKLDSLRNAIVFYRKSAEKPSNSEAVAEPLLFQYQDSAKKTAQTIDAVAVQKIFESGAVNTEQIPSLELYSKAGIPIEATFARTTKTVYSTVNLADGQEWTPKVGYEMAKATEVAFADQRVATATLVRLGGITFGRPFVYPAREKKLVLEPSISKEYDVYWVEFTVSPGEEAVASISEMFFVVTLQVPSAIALELVPLRYATDPANVKTTLKTPDVSVGEGPAKFSVGEFYERTVEYKQLKPTVLATGLHESQFGWHLKDGMVDASSKRLIAIIGVPKRTREVPIVMSVSATIKKSFFQSSKGTTEPQSALLKLLD